MIARQSIDATTTRTTTVSGSVHLTPQCDAHEGQGSQGTQS
ncbi:MAG: hypothetical protein WBP64_11920 [Nitrososphaeraceae archaeon]